MTTPRDPFGQHGKEGTQEGAVSVLAKDESNYRERKKIDMTHVQTQRIESHRIGKRDEYNWTLERRVEGGRVLRSGKVSKEGWRTLGFYPTLRAAAFALLDVEAGARWGGMDPRQAIQEAQDAVVAALGRMDEGIT